MQSLLLSTVIWLPIILSPRKQRIHSKWRSNWLERDHKIRPDHPTNARAADKRERVREKERVHATWAEKQVRAAGYLRQWHRTEPTGFGWNRVRVLEFWERNSFNPNIVASGSFARVPYIYKRSCIEIKNTWSSRERSVLLHKRAPHHSSVIYIWKS